MINIALGKEFFTKVDYICKKERFGSDYGGWDIVTKKINVKSIVYSFGVGEDASFDTALIDKYNLIVHAFDPTPKSIEWVRSKGFSDHFVLHEYGIASFDGTASFNPPENRAHISHTLLERSATQDIAIIVPVKKLSTIMKELGHKRIDILKMDVEGAEYQVIDDLAHSSIRPHQILIEFHHRFPGVGIEKSKEAIAKIRNMGYLLFSISASNEEFCFIKRSGE
jgi:FkbM family methyltransferase